MRISTTRPREANEDFILVNADDIQRFKELFVDQLKDIYWAEKAFEKFSPKMVGDADEPELKEVLTKQMGLIKEQVMRVEDVFATIGKIAEGKVCEAMSGLIMEAERTVGEGKPGLVKDAAIIIAMQKIQHYKIATYGTLCAFANTLDERDGASLLHKTLNEVKGADDELSDIAESIQREMSIQAMLIQHHPNR